MPRLVAFQTLICCIWYHQLFINFNLVWDVELVGCGWMEMSETAHGMFRLALCFAVTLMIRLEICKLLIAWTNSAHKDEVILVVLSEFPSLIITRLDKFVCSIHLFLASVCWCFQAKIHELYLVVCSLMSVEKSEIIIWDYYQKSKSKKLTNLNETLEEAQINMDHEVWCSLSIFLLRSPPRHCIVACFAVTFESFSLTVCFACHLS